MIKKSILILLYKIFILVQIIYIYTFCKFGIDIYWVSFILVLNIAEFVSNYM